MTDTARPPTGKGPLARREARLAWQMLLPTILSVSLVVVLPLLAVFWISVKPVTLADLRPPTPLVSERLRSRGDADFVEYRLRNSSQSDEIRAVVLTDTIPEGVVAATPPDPCIVDGRQLTCDFGTLEPGFRTRLQLPVTLPADAEAAERAIEDETPVTAIGRADNILTSGEFTLQNFARIFDGDEFWRVLWATLFYTVFGTVGALVMGLFAAQLLNRSFRGQGILRGLFLFPYVAPVIAVAFTWVILFGAINQTDPPNRTASAQKSREEHR
jgi:multiple sugar transport system permease protein